MIEYLVATLLIIGSLFMTIAALGLLRMPDLFLRMSCSTKAGTVSIGALLIALALFFSDLGVAARALATIGFIGLTAPIGAHRIGRIAYLVGVPLWKGTVRDEFKNAYPPNACVPFGQTCVIADLDAPEDHTDM